MTAQPIAKTPGPDPRVNSLRGRIADLDVGETVAEAMRLSQIESDDVFEATERLRNRVAPQVARAKAQTGHRYTVENSAFITRAGAVVIAFAITRLD